ncbi:CcdB family protein [Sulfitobacter sp. F26169L]|uniref:CcdB family protein n=1 Tax=Sulfitobacter sp. F26169L TaxID=2996015 RepID=UPI002260EA2B|nr:CcdB family protein [Sulfitobacter sp. F26169L]MCX7567871.1 CcdB family protein [Sulfitobacter sp. F26169L]
MAKCDVFPNPSGNGLLLDVQTDLLGVLNTRVVVPLLPRVMAPEPASRLNPIFEIEGREVVMVTQFLAAVPAQILRQPVTNISDESDKITAAIDMLMQGF